MLYFVAILILAMYIFQITVIVVPYVQEIIQFLSMGYPSDQIVRSILVEFLPGYLIPITIPALGFITVLLVVAGFIRRCNRLIDENMAKKPEFPVLDAKTEHTQQSKKVVDEKSKKDAKKEKNEAKEPIVQQPSKDPSAEQPKKDEVDTKSEK